MKPSEEFEKRLEKAIRYYEGSQELGMSIDDSSKELRKLFNDKNLERRLDQEAWEHYQANLPVEYDFWED